MSIQIQSYQSDAAVYIAQLPSNTPPITKLPSTTAALLDQVLRSSIGKFSNDSLSIQLRAVVSQLKEFTEYDCQVPAHSLTDVVSDVVSCFNDGPSLDSNTLCLFDILLLVMLRGREVVSWEEEMEEAKDLLISEDQEENKQEPFQILSCKLFKQIAIFLRQWSKQIQADPCVIGKLLEMVHTSLSSSPLVQSLPATVHFLTNYLETLMSYSTEGYLSDIPMAFFWQLLEFVSSLAEQGIEPMKAIQYNLPNLFGPFFGVRHHLVSCQLLEYGYLSVCSQHKDALLKEGIEKLVSLWHLFPDIDLKVAEEKALKMHSASLEVCEGIMEELIAFLPLPHVPVPTRPDKDLTPPLEGARNESEEEEEEISEETRQRDRKCRITVLLRLLELACAMVRNYTCTLFICEISTVMYIYSSCTHGTCPCFHLFYTSDQEW